MKIFQHARKTIILTGVLLSQGVCEEPSDKANTAGSEAP